MLLPWSETHKVPSYKSHKNTVFNKYLAKTRVLKQGIKDNSLKEGDKKKLVRQMVEILES